MTDSEQRDSERRPCGFFHGDPLPDSEQIYIDPSPTAPEVLDELGILADDLYDTAKELAAAHGYYPGRSWPPYLHGFVEGAKKGDLDHRTAA